MAIKFNKIVTEEIIHDDDSILTSLYGKIKVADSIDSNKYTYFDTVDGYDLFVSETADDTLAVKCESEDIQNENKIVKDIEKIQNEFDVDLVKYDEVSSTIIVKVLENKTDVLDKIENIFKDDKFYDAKRITPQVLFLEIINVDIQLEDDGLLNKLNDDAVKKIATDLGADSNDTKNKDSAVGFIKGKLSNMNN